MEKSNGDNSTNHELHNTQNESSEPESNEGTTLMQNKDAEIKSSEALIKEKKEKFFKFLKKNQVWVIIILIIALILGVNIRSLPMQDHGGRPGLWDITTDTWTLGPDLDPWLFERYAKIIVEQGSLPEIDFMRNVPVGFDISLESMLLPYMIDWTYHFLNIFSEVSIEYAAVVFPVIMFALTIVVFFLFVREIFVRKSKKSILKANIIALISTFFMIVIPVFLSRTVAGIPEKESAAFFFMFFALYLFLKSWKSKKWKYVIILAAFSGIMTAAMALIWGGAIYLFITISGATLIAFILNKIKKKEFVLYSTWVLVSVFIMVFFSNKYRISSLITSISTGLIFLTFFILLVHMVLYYSKFRKKFENSKIPLNVISLITAFILLIILASIIFGPSFLIEKLKAIHQTIFKPVLGRWNITVAENRQPYFTEWSSSFGPYIKNIPIMFWMFFLGSVLLFKKMLNKLKQKDAWILTMFYILLFFGMVFSRHSPNSVFNGDNFISKSFYYVSAILFVCLLIYTYIKYYKDGSKSYEKINFQYILLFVLFLLTLFTARGAVRLIMVLGPIAPIFVAFLIVESIDKLRGIKDETFKIIVGIFIILIIIGSIFSFWVFYKSVHAQAYSFVPSSYNQQWQKAMSWVRDETPENAVFAHWWDYGYWVQSIGNRSTVLDGGNAVVYWNYLMGRLVLTGDNQEDALEFLYNHNTTHLLIDSSDIGKYTAFASIGSNENYDRYSWIGTYLLDEKQTQETKNQTLLIYPGGTALDEDLVIQENGKEVLLPSQRAGVGAIILPVENIENGTKFEQPYAVVIYQNRQYHVDLRYLHINGQFFDFGSGIEATAFIFPRLDIQGGGVRTNPIGASMFISPRLMRGMLANIYILEDPLERYPNFKIAHTEHNLIVEDLKNQGMDLPDFVFYQGVQGPIKIWDVEYTGNEQMKKEYLDINYKDYLDWKL